MSFRADQNRAAALHEAAHGVAAAAFGYPVREIWIDGDGCGYCRFQHPAFDVGTPAGVYRRLIVALAGWIADAINADKPELISQRHDEIRELAGDAAARDEREELALDFGERGDELDAAYLLLEAAEDPAEALTEAQDEAERIVCEEWAKIEAVAAELLAAEPGTTPPGALTLLES